MRWLAALLVCLSQGLYAASPAELLEQGQLQLERSISPADGAVPGQHMILTLAIATPRWFTGGTRITLPEVPGLIVLQTDQFAANASERRGGETWVVQRWALDIFPQRVGVFEVPPIRVAVKVNSVGGNVEGEIMTEPLTFEVTLPPALEAIGDWVAAPRFRADQSFDRDLNELRVGDAIVRTVTFSAEGVQAMMLPSLEAESLPGLKAYAEPPRLSNRSDRGTMRANRVEQVTYIAEQIGEFQLPSRDFYWWQTDEEALKLVSLPAETIKVVGASAAAEDASAREPINWQAVIPRLIASSLAIAALWFAWRWLPAVKQRIEQWLAIARKLTHRLAGQYRAWRKPGLPPSLNPDSSAVD